MVGAVAVWVASSGPVWAGESVGTLDRVFWVGGSPGAPSASKSAVLTGLYVLSGASLGVTGYFAFDWARASRIAERASGPGVCFELASPSCDEFVSAQASADSAAVRTAASAAAATGLLLGGVLVAQYWENSFLGISVSPKLASIRITAQF